MEYRSLLLAAALLLAVPRTLVAQQIQGRVHDGSTQEPVAAALVQLIAPDSTVLSGVMTADDGRFTIPRDAPANHFLRVTRLGYRELRKPLAELGPSGQPLVIELTAAPVELENVDVEAESQNRWIEAAGFYDRRKLGFGDFVTREEIETRFATAERTADILRTLPGVTVNVFDNEDVVYGRGPLSLQRGGVSACAASVYLDGVLIGNSIPRMRPDNIEAIEVYNGVAQIPAQYGGAHSACGVVLIWLRTGGG